MADGGGDARDPCFLQGDIHLQACGGQGAPAIAGKLPAQGESIIILVENTSISLPVREFKSDMDRIMESIHSALNSVLEAKAR